ncbi:MAG: Abortive infection protein [Clostridia bacterium 41_269]|nr:MAG: Abortive infection protein [Clostridia bacterium 41_269]
MNQKIISPSWNFFDVIITLIFVYTGSYIIGNAVSSIINKEISLFVRYLLAGTVQTLLFIAVTYGVIFFKGKGNLKEIGMKGINLVENIRKGVGGGLILFIIVLFSGFIVSFLVPIEPKPQPFAELLLKADTPFEIFVPFFIGSFLAPLGEEVYFRGFVYPVLRKKFGVLKGIIITALFFAALHFDAVRFIPIAVGGIGLTWLYENTGSLITPIIAHSLWNTLMLVLLLAASVYV